MKISLSEGLAYWSGVAQSDGSFKKHSTKKPRYEIGLGVNKKSLPMVIKFKEISKRLLHRNAKIFKRKNQNVWDFCIGVSRLTQEFNKLDINFDDPPKPPKWCAEDIKFFGAYLAGIIDGDGNIRVKRKRYPQCAVRIISGHKQNELRNFITMKLSCSSHTTRYEADRTLEGRNIHGVWYELEFLISSKNYRIVKEFILPHISIEHKKDKIKSFIENRRIN